jgi:hypothetical protein
MQALTKPVKAPCKSLFVVISQALQEQSSAAFSPGFVRCSWCSVNNAVMDAGRIERSEFRLLSVASELPELAVARSGLRNTTPQFMADKALINVNKLIQVQHGSA